jgi:ribonuclease P protein component
MPKTDNVVAGLKKRAQFLYVAQGVKASGRFLSLQMRKRSNVSDPQQKHPQNPIRRDEIRFGLTASKKVGNAVCRNLARRRLRAALSSALPLYGIAGNDYVAIARPQTILANWLDLTKDINILLKKLSLTKNHISE